MAPSTTGNQGGSTRPYLIRALHEWCNDNGFTPFIAVQVGTGVRVPAEYVKNGEIVLNISYESTNGLKLGNEWIEFQARFGGVARDILVPVENVVAIYARENGQGMVFPAPTAPAAQAGTAPATGAGLRLASTESPSAPASIPVGSPPDPAVDAPPEGPTPPAAPPTGKPGLRRIK